MTGKLMFVPDGWVVVPKEPTQEQISAIYNAAKEFMYVTDIYDAAIDNAPQLTAPPVLRWEGNHLMLGTRSIAATSGGHWCAANIGGLEKSLDEARRAAEKALGFPDGLVVEEV